MGNEKSLYERFMDHVDSDWQWTAYRNTEGYGIIRVGSRCERAHRISYELFNGPIPDDKLVLHSCDDRGCVDPEHLHLGDDMMNAREKVERGRSTKGERNPRAILTDEIVRDIKRKFFNEGMRQADIAREKRIDPQVVNDIILEQHWKHIKDY